MFLLLDDQLRKHVHEPLLGLSVSIGRRQQRPSLRFRRTGNQQSRDLFETQRAIWIRIDDAPLQETLSRLGDALLIHVYRERYILPDQQGHGQLERGS
ncbi:MAG: hypothetical protein ABFD20_04690 [Anaerolineales bacterium]